MKELIAAAKEAPGKLNYGSAGIGGFGHVCAELFAVMTQTKLTHVPYKSTVTAMTETATGQIQVLFNSIVQTTPHIKSGRLRGARNDGSGAGVDPAGAPDDRRSGRSRLRKLDLVGDRRAGAHAAGRSCGG